MYQKYFKRLFDIVSSFCALVVLSPLMIITAIAIKIDSRGPAIFASPRAGKNLVPFTFYKFRSMVNDAPHNVATKLIKSEDYITKVGKFIRKTSIDELPQLLCILKGDMSVVGPRPSILSETDLFEYREKYGANSILPGLTGLAQISGRDILAQSAEEKAKIDGEYAKNITFLGDMKIIFTTAKQVLFGKDVAEGIESVNANKQVEEIEPEVTASTILAEQTEILKNVSEEKETLSNLETTSEEEIAK